MFVITVKVAPKPGTKQATEVGGAYAVCWIDFQLQEGAELLANFYIEKGGWIPQEIKQVSWVDEDYYDTEYEGEDREELRQCYAEADADGFCIVFHQWPADAQDSNEDDGAWQ